MKKLLLFLIISIGIFAETDFILELDSDFELKNKTDKKLKKKKVENKEEDSNLDIILGKKILDDEMYGGWIIEADGDFAITFITKKAEYRIGLILDDYMTKYYSIDEHSGSLFYKMGVNGKFNIYRGFYISPGIDIAYAYDLNAKENEENAEEEKKDEIMGYILNARLGYERSFAKKIYLSIFYEAKFKHYFCQGNIDNFDDDRDYYRAGYYWGAIIGFNF